MTRTTNPVEGLLIATIPDEHPEIIACPKMRKTAKLNVITHIKPLKGGRETEPQFTLSNLL